MTLTTLDWAVVAIPFLIVMGFAIATRRHVRSVADFLSGGRIAGRYLVAVSDGVAAMGLITVVAFFEMFYRSGFTVNYWSQLQVPLTLLLGLTGFVYYRFRETRAMTLAQFFEQRYSRSFRLLTGWLAAIAGVVNYGIFPAVGMRFVIHYANLPETLSIVGFSISTFALGMFCFLTAALMVVLFGGQMAIMVSDCVQGMFSLLTFLVITIVVLVTISWKQMSTALSTQPEGQSLINPFEAHNLQDFNLGFALISLFITVYMTMAWQGNQGYNCAAINPHEAKMGKLLGGWRGGITYAMVLLMTIGAYTYLHHADFAQESAAAQSAIAQVDDVTIRSQVEVPIALAHFLPIGVTGMFLAMMLFLMLSTDTTYLHSWGSIIVQDVILPMRRKPFSPEQQLVVLRLAITGVAVFAYCFSLFYKQTDFILMFFGLTGALYLGGAGACIIGGLYWSRGTASGAWSAMLTGTVLGVSGIILQQVWPSLVTVLLDWWPDSAYLDANRDKFPINGQWLAFFSMLSAMVVYVVVSLLTCRQPFDMDRMLHRGQYALAEDQATGDKAAQPGWLRLVGIDKSFSRGDRGIALFIFLWSMSLFGLWLVATLWNVVQPWPTEWWSLYFWFTGVFLAVLGSVISTIWFIWGGTADLARFFKRVRTLDHHYADDGRIAGAVTDNDQPLDADVTETNEPPVPGVLKQSTT